MAAHAFFFKEGAELQRHFGGGDLDRTHGRAAAAARAVLHHLPQFRQEGGIGSALVHLRVVDGFDDRPEHHVLVAGMVLVGALGVNHRAHLLAFAAAGAGLHRGTAGG